MRPRTEFLEGRPHVVVPVIMLTEGVANGSNGPLYYPPDELRRSVPHWNGRPIVVHHPGMEHQNAANNPAVFTKQRVGTLFNVRYDSKSRALKAEAWLDPGRLDAVDARVARAVAAGEWMEVSTGLFTENEQEQGSFRGKAYVAIARDHRPDHLAILPDQIGACSIKDGAGLCRNQVHGEEPLMMPALVA
jgi:hypothetical protein